MKERILKSEDLIRKISELVWTCSTKLPSDVLEEIKNCKDKTNNDQEKFLLDVIIDNAKISNETKTVLCQDTGISLFFVRMGNKIKIEGESKNIKDIIDESIKVIYSSRKLRPSIIDDPLNGKNTVYNTPAFIHIDYDNSSDLEVNFIAKGGGSENASVVKAIPPSSGFNGVKELAIDIVKEKGINACPPLILGVALGGTIDSSALSSKKALLRKIGERNIDPKYAKMELDLKSSINELGIGAMGLKGNCAILDVFIEKLPRHIASLPVATSVLCHSARRGKITI